MIFFAVSLVDVPKETPDYTNSGNVPTERWGDFALFDLWGAARSMSPFKTGPLRVDVPRRLGLVCVKQRCLGIKDGKK